jgi:hypothetical protein
LVPDAPVPTSCVALTHGSLLADGNARLSLQSRSPGDPGSRNPEEIKPASPEPTSMKKLIVRGDPGIRRDGVIEWDGEEQICFSIDRQGDYHGPDEVQLWCTIGTEDERETFEKREYVPHFLDVDSVDAEALTVVEPRGI